MAKQWGPQPEVLLVPVETKAEAGGRCTRLPGRVHQRAPIPDKMLQHFLPPRREDQAEAVRYLAHRTMASPGATELRAVPKPLEYPHWPRAGVKPAPKEAVVFLS